jgi:ribonucleoside-diphosphate reductase alpha chain
MAKEGSTVSGLMDTLATTISVSLQYGVPLRDLVNKFAHVRFEPSGFTGNQEIPIAKSIVDYIFRWLGSRFLTIEDQQNLGLQPRVVAEDAPPLTGTAPQETSAIRAQSPAPAAQSPSVLQPKPEVKPTESDAPKATAVAAEPATEQPTELKVLATNGQANGHAANGNGKANGNGGGGPSAITLNLGQTKVSFQTQADAPSCADCGSIMIRNGSCYKCLNCGSTSGCS